MGRDYDWLYGHANRLVRQFGVEEFLRENHISYSFSGDFADHWSGDVNAEFRGWGPEKLGKLLELGAGSQNELRPNKLGRTPVADMLPREEADLIAWQHFGGSAVLRQSATMVLLAAMYDKTVVKEGRSRTLQGECTYVIGGFEYTHGPWFSEMDRWGQMQKFPNPYWRPEVLPDGSRTLSDCVFFDLSKRRVYDNFT